MTTDRVRASGNGVQCASLSVITPAMMSAEPAPEARGVAEKPHPDQEGSGGPDAGPHRVGGAERDVPLRQKEQAAADRERDDRYRRADDGPPRLLRPLEPDRPADLAQSGD